MAKSKKQPSEELSTSSLPTIKLTERQKEWVELVYSDTIPLSLTWEGRVAETTRRVGFSLPDEVLLIGSREHFALNIKAEAYWSMVRMYHNVCESIRTPEPDGRPNENSSYKVKIENSLKLKPVMDEIKRMAEDLFKKNEKAEADFNTGKLESDFGEGALEAALREIKHESPAVERKGNKGKETPETAE
jgi:hypothetical protein